MAGSTATRERKTRAPNDDQSATIAELQRKLAQSEAEKAALQSLAKNHPVSRNTGMIDAGGMPVGPGDGEVTMDTDGSPELIRPSSPLIERAINLDLADELAFMEEVVEVEMLTSNEQYPEPCVSVWNDGRHQLFVKGMRQKVKRKFVEVLATRKPIHYGNVEYVDGEGNRRVKWPQRTSLRYPFVVHVDPNPLGRDWLRKVLLQP